MQKFYLNGLLICGLIMVALGVVTLMGGDPEIRRLVIGFGFGVPSLLLWFFFRILVPRNEDPGT